MRGCYPSEALYQRKKEMINLSKDCNPLGLSNKAKHAIRKGIKGLMHLPDEPMARLRRYISQREDIAYENIILGHDTTHLLMVVMDIIKPETIGYTSPSLRWGRLSWQDKAMQGKAIHYPIVEDNGGLLLNLDGLIERLKASVPEVMIISNPIDAAGILIDESQIKRLISLIEERARLIVIDESLKDFVDTGSSNMGHLSSRPLFIIRDFSCFYGMKGLPVCYGIGNAKLINQIERCGWIPKLNSLACSAAIASLKDKGFRRRTIEFIKREKAFLMEGIDKIEGVRVYDTESNLLILDIAKGQEGLKERLFERGLSVDIVEITKGRCYIRLPINTHRLNAYFVKMLKMVLAQDKDKVDWDVR